MIVGHRLAGPTTAQQLQEAISAVREALGLRSGGLMESVHHMFVDVAALIAR